MIFRVLAKPCFTASILKKKMRQHRLEMSLHKRLVKQAASTKLQVPLTNFAAQFVAVFFVPFCVSTVLDCIIKNQFGITGKSEKKAKNEKGKIKALPHKIGYVVVYASFFYETYDQKMSGL